MPTARILKMPLGTVERAAATTAPQDVLSEGAATFDILRQMRVPGLTQRDGVDPVDMAFDQLSKRLLRPAIPVGGEKIDVR